MIDKESRMKLFKMISGIDILFKRWAEKKLKKFDMTFPQFGVMSILLEHEGASQREVADAFNIDSTSVMVICDSLEKKKWIQRKSDPNDRRVNRLFITEEGRRIFSSSLPTIREGYEVFNLITPEELETISPIIEKIYDKIKNLS